MRILLLEENKFHALLIKRELQEKFPEASLSVFRSATAALDEITRNRYDIAIIDNQLSEYQGLEYLQMLRDEDVRLVIIYLAIEDIDRLSERALKAGANEFLVKEKSFHILIPHLIERAIDTTTLRTAREVLHELVQSDNGDDLVNLTVSTLSHEINNPLMTILGEAELLLHNGYRLAPEIDRKVRIIEESALRIKSTLARLASIRKPNIKKTVSGDLIDLKN
ncbi:MAG: response regulator [Candidatus Zixiibacteriota bacterium]